MSKYTIKKTPKLPPPKVTTRILPMKTKGLPRAGEVTFTGKETKKKRQFFGPDMKEVK